MKSIFKVCMPAVAAALAFASVTANAQFSPGVKEDTAQLASDKAALQHQMKRLEADEATLKSDAASGRISAESKDSYAVYMGKQAVAGEEKQIAADKKPSLQMKSDKDALQRQIKRLEVAEARLKSDTSSSSMSAESKDAEKVYNDKQAIKGEKKDIASDKKK